MSIPFRKLRRYLKDVKTATNLSASELRLPKGSKYAKGLFTSAEDIEKRAYSAELSSKRIRKMNADPVFKKAASERIKKLNADPEFVAKARKGAVEFGKSDANLQHLSRIRNDPEFKKRSAERLKQQMSDPAYREKNRLASSIANKKRWAEWRKRK